MAAGQSRPLGPLQLDVTNSLVWQGAQRRKLTPKACAVLQYLMAHPGHVVDKGVLLDLFWPDPAAASEAALTTCIREIRQKLHDHAAAPHYIETVHAGRQAYPGAPKQAGGYRFIGPSAPDAGGAPALGHAGAGAPWPPPATPPADIVGREAAFAQLSRCLARVWGGTRHLLFVTGDPGMGKTTLLEAWLMGLQAQEVWIGRGQCSEHDNPGEAYLPLLEALGRLGRGPAREQLVAVLRQYAPSWLVHLPALLAPGEWEALQRTVDPAGQPRMLRELADAVDVLTAERPLVLVVEDLHWSDRATLAWLGYVARRPDPARLLLLGTYRPGDAVVHAQPVQTILTELQQHGSGEELALEGLSEAAVSASLAQRFGDPRLAADLACILHPRTQGNPLFLRAVVDELVRQQVVTRGPDGWGLQAGVATITAIIPAQLRALIDLQLAHCSPEEQTLLEAASVAGVECAVAAVAAGLEHAPEAVEAQCAALAQQGRWLEARGRAVWPDGTVTACYRFRHALYHEVVYQRIPAGRQSRWHARIGTRLAHGVGERAADMAAALARHFLRGQLLPQAVQSLWQAGDQAVRRGAPQEAVTCYEQALYALEQLPTTPDTLAQAIDLRLALAEALFPLGAFQRVCDTLRAAERLAEALEDHRRLGWVSEALSVACRRLGRYDQAVGCAQRAVALAVSLEDAAMQAWAAFRLGQAAYFLGNYPGAMDTFRQILVAPPEPGAVAGDLMLLPAHARSWLVYCLTHCGVFDEGLVVGAEAIQLAATDDFPTSQCAASASLGGLYLGRGGLQHAIPLLEQSLAYCQRWQDLDWLPECAASLGLAYALAGRLAEALPLLEQAVAQETAMGGGHASIWLPELSQAYLLAGRLEEARAHAERALALARARQERGFQAWALQILGDIAVQGTPLEIEQGEPHYRQALALADELGMRPLQAHCHRGLGMLYAATGQREPARAALSTAIVLYRTMDMTFWLPETEAALAQVA